MSQSSKTILITGATGFVGAVLTRSLSRAGFTILATGRNKSSIKEIEKFAEFIPWDLAKEIKQIDCDVCIHCAGLADDQSTFQDLYNANILASKNLLQSINCKQFIFISSSSVYNFDKEIHVEDEEINLEKLGKYGKTKRMAELVLEDSKARFDSLCFLRPRAIYGIGDRILIPRLVSKLKNDSISLPAHMDINSSLCSINLLAETCHKLINTHKDFDIFNVADSAQYKMNKVFKAVLEEYAEKEVRIKSIPMAIINPLTSLAEILPWRTSLSKMAIKNITQPKVLDTSKINKHCNLETNSNFYEELPKIIQWFNQIDLTSKPNLAWTNINYE